MTRSSIVWKTMNITGSMMSSVIVPNSMPPTTPTPNEMLPLAPAPVDKTSGMSPIIMHSAVMIMGRNLTVAADNTAFTIDMPLWRLVVAYSVSNIEVFDRSPISIISPVCM